LSTKSKILVALSQQQAEMSDADKDAVNVRRPEQARHKIRGVIRACGVQQQYRTWHSCVERDRKKPTSADKNMHDALVCDEINFLPYLCGSRLNACAWLLLPLQHDSGQE